MGYLRAYQARVFTGRTGRSIPMGDPFLGGLGRVIGKIGGKILPAIPGVGSFAKAAIGIGGKLARGLGRGARNPIVQAVAGGAAAGGVSGLISGRGGGADAGYRTGFRSYRRMNVGNIKALRRSIRRVEGFSKLARQTIQMTHRVKLKKRGRK